jgi:type I restriction enzyme S subunit
VQYVEGRYWPHNTALWVKDFKGNLPKYVYYYLQTLNLERFNSGAGVPTLNRNDLDTLEIDVHGTCEQRKIAAILSAYDDLIENNTRRIKILEEMARAIYTEWFVNFRFPGHKKVKMVDSELGPIPEGWEVRPVGELLSFHIGGGWGQETQGQQFPVPAYVIRGTDIPAARQCSIESVPFRYHKTSNLESRKLQTGDIIMEVAGGSKGQPVGRALLVSDTLLRSLDAPAICASFCKLLRVDEEVIAPELFYLHLWSIYQDGRICTYQVQSTGITNFQFDHFLKEERIVVSPATLQERFLGQVRPAMELAQVLGRANANLLRTRDLLLPKLVSGELDVLGS